MLRQRPQGDIMFDVVERIIIQLPRSVLKELNRVAKEEKTSRAAFARDAIELALAERQRNAEFAAIIKSYTENPDDPEELAAFMPLQVQAWPEYEEG